MLANKRQENELFNIKEKDKQRENCAFLAELAKHPSTTADQRNNNRCFQHFTGN